ncbi:phosphatidylinositol N-acetylglucosaminyltransferase subunit P [Trichonephila clavata]|uniref:Phosphatidylinositol N-acetylglucosaminyltransferase subunit P n=1 Tax=Trichonephila clavata TaxID=2740835 RepID=A0A8X6J6K9_TRICU|nr:phosphatidylinositol N-acetylglucosaminyltransferase subunit P [Trichonephila clavata]
MGLHSNTLVTCIRPHLLASKVLGSCNSSLHLLLHFDLCFAFISWYKLMMTPDLSSIQTITDEHARTPKPAIRGSIPPICDIPISEVCHKLYLKRKFKNE